MLFEALRDPDLKVRAVLRHSSIPNPVQRQSFVQSYLDADRPADALPWLQESWGHAARYWHRLRAIAADGHSLLPVQAPDEFEAEIRARHGRESSFWAYVTGTRFDRHAAEGDRTVQRGAGRVIPFADFVCRVS